MADFLSTHGASSEQNITQTRVGGHSFSPTSSEIPNPLRTLEGPLLQGSRRIIRWTYRTGLFSEVCPVCPELCAGLPIPAGCGALTRRGMIPLLPKRPPHVPTTCAEGGETIVTLLKKHVFISSEPTSPTSPPPVKRDLAPSPWTWLGGVTPKGMLKPHEHTTSRHDKILWLRPQPAVS